MCKNGFWIIFSLQIIEVFILFAKALLLRPSHAQYMNIFGQSKQYVFIVAKSKSLMLLLNIKFEDFFQNKTFINTCILFYKTRLLICLVSISRSPSS